ncbi:DNA damage-binding protein 2 [Ataeniobius toweri]|uniref:DNA damage-binding protein 2 n=1 Tax=Ataeniobius toweri TaxID=208326 RepID=A0ABU7B367_9TELE|nr:DNA damage-binding protein 2 [Ataeniobius toweri]
MNPPSNLWICSVIKHTECLIPPEVWSLKLVLYLSQCLQEPFVRSLSSYHFHGASSPFDRRITCLEWHPTHPTTVAAASKGGDIFLWDFEKSEKKSFIRGVS